MKSVYCSPTLILTGHENSVEIFINPVEICHYTDFIEGTEKNEHNKELEYFIFVIILR